MKSVRDMSDAELYAISKQPTHPLRQDANEELDSRQAEDASRRTFAGNEF